MATIAENTPFPTSDAPRPDQASRSLPGSTASSGAAGLPSGGELMSRVVQGAHESIDRLAGRAAPHVDRLEEKLAVADTALHERAEQLREVSEGVLRSVRDGVRENPLAAVGAALLLGLLIARITR